jgi:hypothetical protein
VDVVTATFWDNPVKYFMLLRRVPLIKNMLAGWLLEVIEEFLNFKIFLWAN